LPVFPGFRSYLADVDRFEVAHMIIAQVDAIVTDPAGFGDVFYVIQFVCLLVPYDHLSIPDAFQTILALYFCFVVLILDDD
jgi:hypothetical protein